MVHRVALIALVLLTAAVYAPLRDAPFVYEDGSWAGAVLRGVVPSREFTAWTLQQTTDPGVAHLTNVGIHLGVGLCVAALAHAVAGPAAAVLAAGLFLLHPLNSEAVAYVSGRSDLLMTLGIVLAAWAALWVTGWRWLVIAFGVTMAASSKEIGLIGGVLVAWTLAIYRRDARTTHLAWCGLAIVGGALLGMAWHSIGVWLTMTASNGGTSLAPFHYALVQNGALWALLSRIVWPVGFTIDHDWVLLGPTALLVSGLLTLQAVALIALTWRRAPLVAWALGWLLISVAPRLVFQQSEFLHEQHVYLGMVGVSLGLGAAAARWLESPGRKDAYA